MSGGENGGNPAPEPVPAPALEDAGIYEGKRFRLRVSVEAGLDAPFAADGLVRVADTVLERLGAGGDGTRWDFSVVFCGDAFIRVLNRDFRSIDEPTDILSFEIGGTFPDETGASFFHAGEMVISLERLVFHSSEFNVTLNEELKRLIIHGILHLSGMDHSDNSPGQKMLRLQEEILDTLTEEIVFNRRDGKRENGIS